MYNPDEEISDFERDLIEESEREQQLEDELNEDEDYENERPFHSRYDADPSYVVDDHDDDDDLEDELDGHEFFFTQ